MASFEELGFKVVKAGRYSSICPFCSHLRKPENKKAMCATINNEVGNRWYNCSHCGAKGNIDLREKFDKIYKEARMPKERPKLFPDDVQKFLDFKQISAATALKLGVYTRPAPGKKNLICYPYYFKHTLRNVMFRKPQAEKGDNGPREWQIQKEHGTESIFWGLDDLNFDPAYGPAFKNEIIITEGQTDRMTWYECGYENIISLPMGGLNPKAKADGDKLAFLSKEFLELTKGVSRFILATDNDEVGRYTEAVLAQKLGPERCFRLNYPYGYKDSNEVYAGDAKKGLDPKRKTGIDELYKTATAYPIAGIIRLRDIRNEVKILAQEGLNRGFMTGMKPWDNHLSVKSKILMGVTGIPGCFAGEQLIHTYFGVKPIKEIEVGDKVLSYNHEKDQNEFQFVTNKHVYPETPDRLIKIKMKDGSIIKVTENHEFYTGIGYVKIKDLLISLANGKDLEKNTGL